MFVFQWQTAQVSKYCKKYGLEGQLYVLPTSPSEIYFLYSHLIFDPKREFIFCFLPKVCMAHSILLIIKKLTAGWM